MNGEELDNRCFQMRKTDYVVVSLALGLACRIIARGTGKTLEQTNQEIVTTASNQAHTLTSSEIDLVIETYQKSWLQNTGEIYIQELKFENTNN